MTKYFISNPITFMDSFIHENIPENAVEITDQQWQDLISGQSSGKIIQSDKKGNPILIDPPSLTNEQIIVQYEFAAQKNLDEIAKSWGYDSLAMAASYANSTNAQFKAEAEALIEWRDNYWSEAYTIEAGTLPSSAESFVAALPAPPKKPAI